MIKPQFSFIKQSVDLFEIHESGFKRIRTRERKTIVIVVVVRVGKPPDCGPGVTAAQLLPCAFEGSTPQSELFVLPTAGDILR